MQAETVAMNTNGVSTSIERKAGDHSQIYKQWLAFTKYPFGKRFFDMFAGYFVPYTGSIGARVQELRPGYSKITLRDRRKVRNHLKSVHAIALANLGEYSGNLALLASLSSKGRFIVKGLTMDYHKKSRGLITAECHCPEYIPGEKAEYNLEVTLKNGDGELCATCYLITVVGPIKG